MSLPLFDLGRAAPFHEARDPVNLPVQRRWCDAVGVTNPVHLDQAVAQRSCFGQIISPLAMIDVWTKPGLAYRRNAQDPIGGAYEALDARGFTSAVVVSSELEQVRPLVLGDEVRSTVILESVSDEKSTALGEARFVTSRQDFFVDDKSVGLSRLTVMKFRPASNQRRVGTSIGAASEEPNAAVPKRDALGTVRASTIHAGESVPPVSIPITPTLIVAGALMTSDYYEAHHDRDSAIRLGSRDIFMNIHTTLGLLQGCLGDWLGPNAEWLALRARLGVPNYPGDTMVVVGVVAAVDTSTGLTTIDLHATNGLGTHATGSIEVALPL